MAAADHFAFFFCDWAFANSEFLLARRFMAGPDP